jgi:hypothetical protein
MLLVHRRRVVDMRVNLSDIVKVTMGDSLHVGQLLVFVQQRVQGPLGGEVLEATEGKALCGSVGAHTKEVLEVAVVFLQAGDMGEGLLLLSLEHSVDTLVIQLKAVALILWLEAGDIGGIVNKVGGSSGIRLGSGGRCLSLGMLDLGAFGTLGPPPVGRGRGRIHLPSQVILIRGKPRILVAHVRLETHDISGTILESTERAVVVAGVIAEALARELNVLVAQRKTL